MFIKYYIGTYNVIRKISWKHQRSKQFITKFGFNLRMKMVSKGLRVITNKFTLFHNLPI